MTWTTALGLRSRLQRVTTSGRIIPIIDGLRFVAITGVLLFHLWCYAVNQGIGGPLTELSRVGWFGVELFFVISGFILARGFIASFLGGAPTVPLGAYYLRRLTRLEPPYFIALIVYYVSKTVIVSQAGLAPNLLASMFYVHNLAYGTGSKILGVAWSLEVEIQFYLLVPLLARVFSIRARGLRRLVLVVAIIGTQTLAAVVGTAPPTIIGFLHLFLTGFLLCDIYFVDWRDGAEIPVSRVWDIVGLVAWASLFLVLRHFPAFRPLIPLLLLAAYTSAFRGPLFRSLFSAPFVYISGGMCYTMYLYHTLILSVIVFKTPLVSGLCGALGPALGYLVTCLVALLAVLSVSAILFALFEKPFMRRDWPLRVWRWMRGLRAPA